MQSAGLEFRKVLALEFKEERTRFRARGGESANRLLFSLPPVGQGQIHVSRPALNRRKRGASSPGRTASLRPYSRVWDLLQVDKSVLIATSSGRWRRPVIFQLWSRRPNMNQDFPLWLQFWLVILSLESKSTSEMP